MRSNSIFSTVALSLGSNSIDKEEQVKSTLEELSAILKDCKISSVYSTPPIGGVGNDYLNCVVIGQYDADKDTLNAILKQIEIRHGRTDESKILGSISIDIDIVIFNNEIIRLKDFHQSYFQLGYKEISI